MLDLDRFELCRAGQVHHLEPQVFEVLAHLARNHDRVVTKEELLDVVWGDRFVSESALTSRIRAARAAVGDDGRAQRVIRTVHGRGYAWACPVEAETPPTRLQGNTGVPASPDGPGADLVLERESELASVCGLVSGLRKSDRGGVVCLSGGAGLGKTTLVRTVIASISGPVLLGGCEDLTTPRPLGPFRDMVLPAAHRCSGAMPTHPIRPTPSMRSLRSRLPITPRSSSSRTRIGLTTPRSTCCACSCATARRSRLSS